MDDQGPPPRLTFGVVRPPTSLWRWGLDCGSARARRRERPGIGCGMLIRSFPQAVGCTHMRELFDSVGFAHGPTAKNRFMLSPLTNAQSHEDGRLSDDEFNWLTLRARGGFGLTVTCASHVQPRGQGFPGQLGIFSDEHLGGLSRLAAGLKAEGSRPQGQLHPAGMRS